ncbi:MAG: hypothetical protein AB1746_17035 [Candidatus Zixiibacteriota bacterium]
MAPAERGVGYPAPLKLTAGHVNTGSLLESSLRGAKPSRKAGLSDVAISSHFALFVSMISGSSVIAALRSVPSAHLSARNDIYKIRQDRSSTMKSGDSDPALP